MPADGDGFKIAAGYVEIGLKDNTQADLDAIRARIEGQGTLTLKTRLGAPDTADLDAKKAAISREVTDLKTRLKVEVDRSSLLAAEAQIRALGNQTAARASTSAPASTASAGSGGGGFGGGMAGLIAGGIGLGAGPIGGAALAIIPAAFAAIGIAAEKSNADVSSALTGMTAAAKASVQDGFAPMIPAIVEVAGQAKAAVTGLRPVFAEAAVSAGPLLETVSSGLITATSDGVRGATQEMGKLQPIADEVSGDFGKVERGVIGLFAAINVSSAAQGLSILGTDLEQILPAVGSVLNTVMPLGNALLSVLGPALRDTASDVSILRPIMQGLGAVISFLGPDISTLGPIVLALAGGSKLLTGSWTDLSGAGSKLASFVSDLGSKTDALAGRLGYTTAASKASAVASADAAVASAQDATARAKLVAATDAQVAVEAAANAEAKQTVASQLAAAKAMDVAAASAKAAAGAEETLAFAEADASAAAEASSFAFGPLGIAIGVVGALLIPLLLSTTSAAHANDDLAASLESVTTALNQSNGAINSQVTKALQSSQAYKDLIDPLQQAGVSQDTLTTAIEQGGSALDGVRAKLQSTIASHQHLVSEYDASGNAIAGSSHLIGDSTAQSAQTALDALNRLAGGFDESKFKATAAFQAIVDNGTPAAMAVVSLGESWVQASADLGDFLAKNPGASMGAILVGVTQAAVAVPNAIQSVTDHFKQTAQAAAQASQSLADANHSAAQSTVAIADANHAYQQSIVAVGDAQHAYQQSQQAVVAADQGVVTAHRAVLDAIASEGVAENNLTKSQVAATQAQVALNLAREKAVEDLKSMHLQLADQVTSEQSAQVALFDQTRTSGMLGVDASNAQAIAAETVTSTNEQRVTAAIDLIKAENSLNDTLNTGANLRKQVATADRAGVEGAPGVVSAVAAVANANDQVLAAQLALVKAQQAVSDAQGNELKARQAVADAIWNENKASAAIKDALYNESKAHLAVSDALYNRQKALGAVSTAQAALTVAQDANSRTLDINTEAGRANMTLLATTTQTILDSHEPLWQQYQDLFRVTNQFFGNRDATFQWLQQVHAIPPFVSFDIHGVATIDMTQLEQSLYPGSTPQSISADLARLDPRNPNFVPSAAFHAEGGPIVGPGGPMEDKVPLWGSAGEWMIPSYSSSYYGSDAMSAVQNRKVPRELLQGYAAGGPIQASSAANMGAIMLSGYYGALGSGYEVGGRVKKVFGFPFQDLPVAPTPGAPVILGGLLGGGGQIAYSGPMGVAQWSGQILQALAMLGQPASWLGTVERRMQQESGGNPTVVNRWDSNWARGTPSVGLMQVIGPTFRGNAGPFLGTGPYEYGVSVNPLANIYAGLHYAIGRYGSLSALNRPGGYDQGGFALPGTTVVTNSTGVPEMLLPPKLGDSLERLNTAVQGARGGDGASAPVQHVEHHYHIVVKDNDSAYHVAQLVGAQSSWNSRSGRR